MLSAKSFIKNVHINVIAVGAVASAMPVLMSRLIDIHSVGLLILACSVSCTVVKFAVGLEYYRVFHHF